MNSKETILIVCDKNPNTSFGRLSLDIKEALITSGFACKILWLETPKYFPNGTKENQDSLKAHSLETGFFSFRFSFPNYLKKLSPNKILFIRPELGFLCPVAKKTLPKAAIVFMVHDTFAETLYPNSLKFKLLNRFFISPTTQAHTFLFNSKYTEKESNAYFGKPNIPGSIVGCPISAKFFEDFPKKTKEEKLTFWESFGIKGFQDVCLNISLDEPRKNLKTFFELASKRQDLAFVRVGHLKKSTEDSLKKLNLKNLFHFSELDFNVLRDFYRNASVFIYPSFLEGFGLPPLEALACKTPVIASNTTALQENLLGIVPLINPADDVNAYNTALNQVLSHNFEFSEEKIQNLLNHFSPKAFAKRVSIFFENLKFH